MKYESVKCNVELSMKQDLLTESFQPISMKT